MKNKSPINEMSAALIIAIFWIAFILLTFTISAHAATYQFKYKQNVTAMVDAASYEDAFRVAAKICYMTLSKNIYPGEEKGLEYIDICANPLSDYAKKKK